MSRQFTIVLTRIKMMWLHRQLTARKEKIQASGAEGLPEITNLVITAADLLEAGIAEKDKLMTLRHELEEAIQFNTEPSAIEEAKRQLDALPTEETYRVTFDRATAKFALRQVEAEIEWIRNTNIPNLEKRTEFPDKIMTKVYYLNKAKKAKSVLEEFKKELEKELS